MQHSIFFKQKSRDTSRLQILQFHCLKFDDFCCVLPFSMVSFVLRGEEISLYLLNLKLIAIFWTHFIWRRSHCIQPAIWSFKNKIKNRILSSYKVFDFVKAKSSKISSRKKIYRLSLVNHHCFCLKFSSNFSWIAKFFWMP